MKKLLISFLALALILPMFISCKDKEDEPQVPEEFKNYPYSSLTPEQQKEKLEADAQKLFDQINGFSESKALELLRSFNERVEQDEPKLPNSTTENIIYIKDFHGTFTWDKVNNVWVKTDNAEKLTFILPSKRTGTENNGKIEVTGVNSGVVSNKYDLPKELKATLYVDNTQVGNIEVKATEISVDKAPKTATVAFTLDDYIFVMNAEKGTTSTSTFQLKKGENMILEGTADLSGNVDAMLDDKEKPDVSNAEVKILDNLVAYGTIDYQKLDDQLEAINDKYNKMEYTAANRKAHVDEECDANNKYIKMELASRDNKTKIASFIYMPKEEQPTYYSPTEYFKFNDDTTVEIGVYFTNGFDAAVNSWTNFIKKF